MPMQDLFQYYEACTVTLLIARNLPQQDSMFPRLDKLNQMISILLEFCLEDYSYMSTCDSDLLGHGFQAVSFQVL